MRPALRLPLLILALLAAPPTLAGERVPPVASYRIEATYTKDHRIVGKETVTFTNRTRHSFPDLQLHLYLNAFRNDLSTFAREAKERGRFRAERAKPEDERWYGYSSLNRVELLGGGDLTPGLTFLAPDDGNLEDRTVVSVPLPQPVAPGQAVVVTIDFEAKLPRVVARTGWKDDLVFAAQWFPKLGVAADSGWVTHQFHAATEFFADFGDYDVTLTLPSDAKGKVGASGVLKEEAEVAGGHRVRFVAEDVHDFAWTYSPRFDVHRETFTHPGLPNVEIVLFLQPDHRAARERYLAAVRAGLTWYGRWYVPYPYPVLTVVDPAWGSSVGGMEYPTLFTGNAHWLPSRAEHSPESVTVHEFGHQIFYGLLASNEFAEAHLDEGFNTYATMKTLKRAFGDPSLVRRFFGIPIAFRRIPLVYPEARIQSYLDWQARVRSDPTTATSFRNMTTDSTRQNAYNKTAAILASAERTLGEETWARIMKKYATRWAFRHPATADFRAVVREVAGPAADELFSETWGSTNSIDYAVAEVSGRKIAKPVGYAGGPGALKFAKPEREEGPARYESIAVVRRMGEAFWPVDVLLTFENGKTVRKTWDGKARWIRYRAIGPKLTAVEVDPDRKLLLDVDLLNNGKSADPDRATGAVWDERLRHLAQHLLEFCALLGAAR